LKLCCLAPPYLDHETRSRGLRSGWSIAAALVWAAIPQVRVSLVDSVALEERIEMGDAEESVAYSVDWPAA
jgi:hypothetical protein